MTPVLTTSQRFIQRLFPKVTVAFLLVFQTSLMYLLLLDCLLVQPNQTYYFLLDCLLVQPNQMYLLLDCLLVQLNQTYPLLLDCLLVQLNQTYPLLLDFLHVQLITRFKIQKIWNVPTRTSSSLSLPPASLFYPR